MKNVKVIFWDFDGVIMNSNETRDYGFVEVLKDFPKDKVQLLIDYHKSNGGLSRYVKFRYLYENILKESVTDERINELASRFSKIMRVNMVNEELLISETVNFIKKNHRKYIMYVTSGSDQNELRFLCEQLDLSKYFVSVHGSPKPKTQWITELIAKNNYAPSSCLIIGDSINDFQAGDDNGINFVAYNNLSLEKFNTTSINFNL